jgi:hypothetical protein
MRAGTRNKCAKKAAHFFKIRAPQNPTRVSNDAGGDKGPIVWSERQLGVVDRSGASVEFAIRQTEHHE